MFHAQYPRELCCTASAEEATVGLGTNGCLLLYTVGRKPFVGQYISLVAAATVSCLVDLLTTSSHIP